MSRNRVLAVVGVALLSVLAISACKPLSHEEKVAELRSHYEARVNGFYIKAEPVIVEAVAEPEGAEESSGTEETAEVEMPEEPAVVQNAHLDLIVQHDSNETLPGITIEIVMVDANQQEKGSWQIWVDTSTLRKANQLQLVHVLEDVPYIEGDGFAAEVRTPIPAAERGDYREFAPQG